eukprot:1161385-Pelagomonas_calceolata.AAC.6
MAPMLEPHSLSAGTCALPAPAAWEEGFDGACAGASQPQGGHLHAANVLEMQLYVDKSRVA